MIGRRPTGVILTGGGSRRMGADKAFVTVAGRPMVVAVADALWEAGCQPVECQGGDVERLAALGMSCTPDSTPDQGPVAAIEQARRRYLAPVVVAACDLARLDAATVRLVIETGERRSSVAVAAADGYRHLLSYWPPEAPAPETVEMPYHDALELVGAVDVAVESAAMYNVNGPDDL